VIEYSFVASIDGDRLLECNKCAAVVTNTARHTRWHNNESEPEPISYIISRGGDLNTGRWVVYKNGQGYVEEGRDGWPKRPIDATGVHWYSRGYGHGAPPFDEEYAHKTDWWNEQ